MNAPASLPTVKPGQTLLKGRCKGVRKYENKFYHLVALPADDAYSMPQLIEFESNLRRFSTDEDVSVVVKVGGYPNTYKTNQNGETLTINSARNTLVGVFQD